MFEKPIQESNVVNENRVFRVTNSILEAVGRQEAIFNDTNLPGRLPDNPVVFGNRLSGFVPHDLEDQQDKVIARNAAEVLARAYQLVGTGEAESVTDCLRQIVESGRLPDDMLEEADPAFMIEYSDELEAVLRDLAEEKALDRRYSKVLDKKSDR